jgi:WD40 repeat protein
LPTTPITPANGAQVTALACWEWVGRSLDWHPDASRLAITSHTALRIFDAATLVEVFHEPGDFCGLAWSPDGCWLAAQRDRAIQVWNWDGVRLTRGPTLKGDPGHWPHLAFSPDGTLLAYGMSCTPVKLWSVADGRLLRSLEGPAGSIADLAFSPDGTLLAVFTFHFLTPRAPILLAPVSGDGPVRQLPVGERSPIRIGFVPDGTILLGSEAYGPEVHGWEIASGRQLTKEELTALRLPPGTRITPTLAAGPDGALMVAFGNSGVKINVPNSDTTAIPLQGHWAEKEVCFAPGAAALAAFGETGTARVLRLDTGTEQAVRDGALARIATLAVAPDGATAAVVSLKPGTSDFWVRLWRLTDGTPIGTLPGYDDWPAALAYTPDGSRLLVGTHDAGIAIREMPGMEQVATLPCGHVSCLAVSPDGQRLAVGQGSGELLIWDLATLTLRTTIPAHKDAVSAVSFLPDGQTILTAGTDLWGRLWRTEDGAPVAKLKHNRQVFTGAASPDGKLIATGCRDKCVYVWNARDGSPIRTIAAGRSSVLKLAWSAGSDVLASTSAAAPIQLWNPATGDLLATLKGHTGDIVGLAFHPTGSCLISGGSDGTLRLWGVN